MSKKESDIISRQWQQDKKRSVTMTEQERKELEKDDWIEEQNKKIIHWLWIIFISMITALITTLVYTA